VSQYGALFDVPATAAGRAMARQVEQHRGGKQVWVELTAPPPEPPV
jgi:hypothetical protein